MTYVSAKQLPLTGLTMVGTFHCFGWTFGDLVAFRTSWQAGTHLVLFTGVFSATITMFGPRQVLNHFLFSEWLLQFTQHRNRLIHDLTHPLVPF